MGGGRKVPTIQDVAREARVSAATVSRALSTPERVTGPTRARVDEAVRLTGYTVNFAARSLRKQTGRTIVVALPNVGNTFFTPIVDSIERAAWSRGYSVLLSNRRATGDEGADLAEFFLSNRADGLLLFDGTTDIGALKAGGRGDKAPPIVVVCEAIPNSRLPTVKSDNRGAARFAVEHLISLGHRRIAHLAAPRFNVLYDERSSGVRDAFETAGLPYDPGLEIAGDFSLQSGVAAARQFMDISPRPTAVFCACDNMAVGLISELRNLGVECPRDVSVVGFDDIPIARHFWPRLTTVRQQQGEMGRIATDMLVQLLGAPGGQSCLNSVILPCELVVRGSARLLKN